jgi:thiamine-monophosphate kinase
VGLSALGLRALQRGLWRHGSLRVAIEHWRRPKALLAEGQKLVGRAHAAIDVSDGLAGDAAHLARASAVRVVFDAVRLEAALAKELLQGAAALGESALTLALTGGEDYALLAAGPPLKRPRAARRVGHIERGRGVFLERAGHRQRLGAGFEHFAATPDFRKRY